MFENTAAPDTEHIVTAISRAANQHTELFVRFGRRERLTRYPVGTGTEDADAVYQQMETGGTFISVPLNQLRRFLELFGKHGFLGCGCILNFQNGNGADAEACPGDFLAVHGDAKGIKRLFSIAERIPEFCVDEIGSKGNDCIGIAFFHRQKLSLTGVNRGSFGIKNDKIGVFLTGDIGK